MVVIAVLLFILAGCAVRCDDPSYYVVEIPAEEVASVKRPTDFRVYWNVPTMQCRSKGVTFSDLRQYGIIQNDHDHFRGESVAILYDPGDFPALFKDDSTGRFRYRNGGVPQEGSMETHIEAFRLQLNQSVPDVGFKGIGIIDFESWRPVFRQNFGVLVPYKDVSYEIERKRHPYWFESWVLSEAIKRFEESGRAFMQTTISIAKQMRPRARWGYYGFPYCFNMAHERSEACARGVLEENDRTSWLWSESSALFPSVYSPRSLTGQQLAMLVRGRVAEASRVARADAPVLPYFWFKYRDGGFMSEKDLKIAVDTLYRSNASGFIVWGSSNDVNTMQKCKELHTFVQNILGPTIAKYTKPSEKLSNNNLDDRISTEEEHIIYNTTIIATTENHVKKTTEFDPEIDWKVPENYTENVVKFVEEKYINKTTQKHKIDITSNETALLDIVLNEFFNNINHKEIENNNQRIEIVINTPVLKHNHTTDNPIENISSHHIDVSDNPITRYNFNTSVQDEILPTETSTFKHISKTEKKGHVTRHHHKIKPSTESLPASDELTAAEITKTTDELLTTATDQYTSSTDLSTTENIEDLLDIEEEIFDYYESEGATTENIDLFSYLSTHSGSTTETTQFDATSTGAYDSSTIGSTTDEIRYETSKKNGLLELEHKIHSKNCKKGLAMITSDIAEVAVETSTPDTNRLQKIKGTKNAKKGMHMLKDDYKDDLEFDDAFERHPRSMGLLGTLEEVNNSSPRAIYISKSKHFMCFFFFFYSIAKCVCELYHQC